MTRWIDPTPATPGSLSKLGLSPLIESILLRRGITGPAEADAFLRPDTIRTADLPGTEKMVGRLLEAIERNETICVWGDFDVDGQTSTSVLVQALLAAGAHTTYHVPVRSTEGHGIGIPALRDVLDAGVDLLLTCDTGVTAHDAVALARERQVDVLITDHHDPQETLPEAYAILNPKLLPGGHSLADLAGVGVAYKLAEGLLAAVGRSPIELLDLVALGLIADVAILRADTRALAHSGIRALRSTSRPGLRVLAEQSKVDLATVTEETIGFVLSPRLNAVGRLGDAAAAVELLLSQDPVRARVVAAQIEGLNTQRRLLTDQVLQAAEAQIAADPSLLRRPILMLEHASWPGGVLGLVASRLVDRYRKPTIMLSRGEDHFWRGSARSVEGLHITKVIAACHDLLSGYGGHPMAAGLSVPAEQLAVLHSRIQAVAAKMLVAAAIEEDTVQIDEWIALGDHSLDLAAQLEQLAPFGPGNPAPTFATRGVVVDATTPIGPIGEHLKLTVADGAGGRAEILWWNARSEELPRGATDIAYSIRASGFRGTPGLAITLVDFRPQGRQPSYTLTRDIRVVDLRAVAVPSLPPDCLVWVEGTPSKSGANRMELQLSPELAIWTAPPGNAELVSALRLVRPHTVYLVAHLPEPTWTALPFLQHLAGMAKYALNKREGEVKIAQLAAACAQRELTVRIGLQWLSAAGHIGAVDDGDVVSLTTGSGQPTPALQRELLAGVTNLLEETGAYREHFRSAAPTLVVQSQGSIRMAGGQAGEPHVK